MQLLVNMERKPPKEVKKAIKHFSHLMEEFPEVASPLLSKYSIFDKYFESMIKIRIKNSLNLYHDTKIPLVSISFLWNDLNLNLLPKFLSKPEINKIKEITFYAKRIKRLPKSLDKTITYAKNYENYLERINKIFNDNKRDLHMYAILFDSMDLIEEILLYKLSSLNKPPHAKINMRGMKKKIYLSEAEFLYKFLYAKGFKSLSKRLDDLFLYLKNPKTYLKMEKKYEKKDLCSRLSSYTSVVSDLLSGEDVSIYARVKGIHSSIKKICTKYNMTCKRKKLNDMIGIKIVVNSNNPKDVYKIAKKILDSGFFVLYENVNELYSPYNIRDYSMFYSKDQLENLFKNAKIKAKKKESGYSALHMIVRYYKHELPFEIQLKTRREHIIAEEESKFYKGIHHPDLKMLIEGTESEEFIKVTRLILKKGDKILYKKNRAQQLSIKKILKILREYGIYLEGENLRKVIEELNRQLSFSKQIVINVDEFFKMSHEE